MNGSEVRNIRKYLDLNQEEFGKKIGVSKNTVSNWENNIVKIPNKISPRIKQLMDEAHSIPNQCINGNYNNLVGGNSNVVNSNENIEYLKQTIQYLQQELQQKELRITKLLEEQEILHKQISVLIEKIIVK